MQPIQLEDVFLQIYFSLRANMISYKGKMCMYTLFFKSFSSTWLICDFQTLPRIMVLHLFSTVGAILSIKHLVCRVLCLVAQLCATLCDPMDCSPPGSCVCVDPPGKKTGVGSGCSLPTGHST